MGKYIPKPIDLSQVELSEELLDLTELLANNVHETWAAGRIAEGWQYGQVRNEGSKQHPCLVPYEELNESERDFDRRTAMDTLKTILQLGFVICKKKE